MLRRDVGNFPRPLGIAYIIVQILGGFCGALISWFLNNGGLGGNILLTQNKYYFQAIVIEVLGTFVVVFFYLTQTEEKTVLSKEKAITCFIIAASYIGARALCAGNHITYSGAVLNPAIAIGTSFTQLFSQGGDNFKNIWLYGGVPFAGGIVAILFYEFVFKKTQEVLNEEYEAEEDVDTLLDK